MTDTITTQPGAVLDDLPDDMFGYIEPGGTKDFTGKTEPRSLRHFPLHDEAAVKQAMKQLAGSPFEEKARSHVEAAARKHGLIEPPPAPQRAVAGGLWVREFDLADVHIVTRAQDAVLGDGRTVEALVAPFDVETPIADGQGRYRETINRNAFDRTIAQLRPQGRRATWKVGVFYNHGMTIHGTPSDTNSRPIGVPIEIRTDPAGLITVTRYLNNPLADDILDAVQAGAITGHSFTGRVVRSNPEPGRLGYRPQAGGKLPLVERLELGLREYGPTPFPAYDTTHVMNVRSYQLAGHPADELDELDAGPPDDSTSPDGEPAPGDPPPDEGEHSDRSDDDRAVKHAALATRIAQARAVRPGL